jgi:hypothetical protein
MYCLFYAPFPYLSALNSGFEDQVTVAALSFLFIAD